MPLGALLQKKYDWQSLPNLESEVAIVTGANSGLGYSTSKWLARLNATVVLACRNLEKGARAMESLAREVPGAKLKLIRLDLADLQSVRDFVNEFKSQYGRLDMLINNAGLHNAGYYESKYGGLEHVWVVNHIAPSYLTFLLLDTVRHTPDSRVVFLSSMGLNYPNRSGREAQSQEVGRTDFSPMFRYCDTKLANYRFSAKLARYLRAQGVDNVYVNSVHPGMVRTEFAKHIYQNMLDKVSGLPFLSPVVDFFHGFWKFSPNLLLSWDPDTAALTTVHAAAAPEISQEKVSGQYFVPVAQRIAPFWDIGASEEREDDLWAWTLEFLQQHAGFDETSLRFS